MKRIFLYNELRMMKDSLPPGSMKTIADKLGISEETVKSFFMCGSSSFLASGIRYEQGGVEGGIVEVDDGGVYDCALEIITAGYNY